MDNSEVREMNKRKGKIPYTIWPTEEEEKKLINSLDKGLIVDVITIMDSIYKRGDFEKR